MYLQKEGFSILKKIIALVLFISLFVILPAKATAGVDAVRLNDVTFLAKTDTHKFNIKYPKIISSDNKQQINEKIEATIYNIKKISEEMIEESLDGYVDLTSVYEVKQNKNNILSIIFKSTINYGGAHPVELQSALTFDTITGNLYSLKELFPKNPDYEKLINDEITKQLKSDYYKNTDFYKFKSIDKNQSFYIEDNMLVIFFDQYAYAPRQFGFAEFIIPFFTI